jgi:hypothetical protein
MDYYQKLTAINNEIKEHHIAIDRLISERERILIEEAVRTALNK